MPPKLSASLQVLSPEFTLVRLNQIKNLFSRKIYDDFIDCIGNTAINIYKEKKVKSTTIYVPAFFIIEPNEEKNTEHKGFGATIGIVIGSRRVDGFEVDCGFLMTFFKAYKNHPSDDILDEYNRVKGIADSAKENNYENVKYDLPKQKVQ